MRVATNDDLVKVWNALHPNDKRTEFNLIEVNSIIEAATWIGYDATIQLKKLNEIENKHGVRPSAPCSLEQARWIATIADNVNGHGEVSSKLELVVERLYVLHLLNSIEDHLTKTRSRGEFVVYPNPDPQGCGFVANLLEDGERVGEFGDGYEVVDCQASTAIEAMEEFASANKIEIPKTQIK
jgi:hypothetical protein